MKEGNDEPTGSSNVGDVKGNTESSTVLNPTVRRTMEPARSRLGTSSGRTARIRERGRRNRAVVVRSIQLGLGTQCDAGTDSSTSKKVLPRHIMDLMRVSGRHNDILGVRELKDKKSCDVEETQCNYLVQVVKNNIVNVAFSFLPNDGLDVLFEAMEQLVYPGPIRDKISDVFTSCGPRTREKRPVRAMIVVVFGSQEARCILALDSSYRFTQVELSGDEEFGEEDGED